MSPVLLSPTPTTSSGSSKSSQSLSSSATSSVDLPLATSVTSSQSQPAMKKLVSMKTIVEGEGEGDSDGESGEDDRPISTAPVRNSTSRLMFGKRSTIRDSTWTSPSHRLLREEYRQWVRDHAPFIVLPPDYYPPNPTPPGYSVTQNGRPLLHYGVAFTHQEVIDYALANNHLQRSDLKAMDAPTYGLYAARGLVRDLSKKVGIRLEAEFPLSLTYHYVAAVCNTNNMSTKRVKKRRVAALERCVKESFGANHDLRWWWDMAWTDPRNGLDPSWIFTREFTGDAEGSNYDPSQKQRKIPRVARRETRTEVRRADDVEMLHLSSIARG
ncbi:hypothetical protein C8T65DRAFT_639060 [Cerioporus squamosus]|nr:hypothetical protein C8T65DRAFT_639060 [Cerioporus squamosus]